MQAWLALFRGIGLVSLWVGIAWLGVPVWHGVALGSIWFSSEVHHWLLSR